MRNENRVNRNAIATQLVASYHGSRHDSMKLFTSDRWKPLPPNAKSYGMEIETACTWINVHNVQGQANESIGALLQEVILKEFPRDLFRWEKDGSITGAEIVTQCMTKEFIRNHYKEWKNLYDVYFPRFGFTPDYRCGMHVNIGRALLGGTYAKQLDTARKLCYFVNKHWELSLTLFGRERETQYCARNSHFANKATMKEYDPRHAGSDHYTSFNWGHFNESETSARIELRVVGGQKKFAMFRNTMETVFHMVDACKRVSWNDIDNLEKVFAGCNKYVLSRLEKAKNEYRLDSEIYDRIALASDTETEYI